MGECFSDSVTSDCLFCEIPQKRVIASNEFAFVILDGFPVSEHHTLIIPKRHVVTYFEPEPPEVVAIHQLMLSQKNRFERLDSSVTGFNIGINCGKDSGQTIFHCHMHLIPRRARDVANPRGGVRHIIPGKGDYSSTPNS